MKNLEVRNTFSCNSFSKHFIMCDTVCNDISVLICVNVSS